MTGESDDAAAPVGAANQRHAHAYNKRLVLSDVRRRDKMSKSEIAKRTGLSVQAVSVIIKSLEDEELLLRREPIRGKVGQPSIPMSIDPEGAFSIGLKIGRRSAELVFGRGGELNDFIYFFIGTFVGGGVVLNHAVFTGQTGNAGAVGSMPVVGNQNPNTQLIDHASISTFENILREHNRDPSALWLSRDDWSQYDDLLQQWIPTAAAHMAVAIASSCAVIDFTAVVIDGSFPAAVRSKLVSATKMELNKLNLQGIMAPEVLEGRLGAKANAVGAACLPLYSQYLLDQNVLFK